MRTFPAEFEALLSAHGRRVLAGRAPEVRAFHAAPARRFLYLERVLEPKAAKGCLALLERHLLPHLTAMEAPIPPEATWGMTENYGELLPKTSRVLTATLERKRARSSQVAAELGLVRMLASESFRAFAQALCPRPLRRRWGQQVLCYRAGDYAGPHNDHHPEDEEGRDGYFDVHVSLVTPAVAHQWLVYEKGGHFSELQGVARLGAMTAYKLPFWHYTTPLVARRGQEEAARRWVLLGTFPYA